eukprot:XP_011619926.1 PREDICTED: coiled-coil domain-containing protein 141 [Takifugu rubripes]
MDLKKRFRSLKLNFLKRNDRTRNVKAIRNQLQQVELYEEKLQVLQKRLQALLERVRSEVKEEGAACEARAAVSELQRQMREFEQSICNHQRTLEMTHKLQQATEEYHFWSEEASATIARLDRASSECRSTDAVSLLYQQFQTFEWPALPEQDERISRITAHGEDQGQRCTEKTVSKHSEVVGSIKELSDRLMELEAKLKLRQQEDGDQVMEEETVEKDEETEEAKEKNLKENRRMKDVKRMDKNKREHSDELLELKETGHTPELAAVHDGKAAASRKQLSQKTIMRVTGCG